MPQPALKPRKALNKAFLKVKPNRAEIEAFKANLTRLIDNIQEGESEEFHKNLVADFLKNTYYKPNHFINTSGRNDLVIHNDKKSNSSIGVIIEAKSPTNKSEMLTKEKLNTKALQELVLYYLRERITNKNLEVKHLVVSNIYEWFIFNAQEFDRYFAQNKPLVKQFEDFAAGRLSETKTDFFYREIAKPAIEAIEAQIEFTHFDIRAYEKPLRNSDKKDDTKLIALFKLLSPEHLLKLPFANDSNSLDKRFYSELLHIIGLTETKQGSKKVIERNPSGKRNEGSLLENAVIQLDSLDKINRLERPSQYGTNNQERLFNVGLELTITWVNRILFLKLLEAQLLSYHGGDKSYEFLSFNKLKNYDELNKLFFQVLAKKREDRNSLVQNLFSKVPYLNSSLFEGADIEHDTIFISNLEDEYQIPIHSATVLKDQNGRKRTGNLNTLEYLFAFLNAYDFSSEGAEEIQEDNKALINASVLGLIFEKINGYKDGSFFTPGFITMYMCRETIRKAVIQKFNDAKGWNCSTFDDLYDKIEDRTEANAIINSLKLCDPAVGSGHFLVSALNEIIALKSDLKILQDRDGKRLKEYQVEVVNDELVITDDEGQLFEYKPSASSREGAGGVSESQRVQQTLFHEKQTIIENCLFGVDINPNSVKICRLRLWIELLKSAYYKTPLTRGAGGVSVSSNDGGELETLPNIDINIKCGNSLISRFDLNADLKQALKKSKFSIDSYRVAVSTYRNAKDKAEKREMTNLIQSIKTDFRTEISRNSREQKQLDRLSSELYHKYTAEQLFTDDLTAKQQKQRAADKKKLEEKITTLTDKIDEIKNNKIYENAFEWRFEFPEVLSDDGDYIGFDVVIGNPPYVQLQTIKEESKALKTLDYVTYSSMSDLYALFYELGANILKQEGMLNFITGSAWLRTNYGQSLRTFFANQVNITEVIDLSDCEIFESATVLTSIIQFSNTTIQSPKKCIRYTRADQQKLLELKANFDHECTYIVGFTENTWIISDPKTHAIREKVESLGKRIKEWDVKINRGILTGYNDAFVINTQRKDELIEQDPNAAELIKPMLRGRDVLKYRCADSDLWLIGTFPSLDLEIEKYPSIETHLKKFMPKLNQTGETFITVDGQKAKSRKKTSGQWFETQDSIAYWKDFLQPKIVYPNMTKFLPFTLDTDQSFVNDKCFILTGEKLFYLVSVFNSKLFRFCFADAFPELQGNSKEIKKFVLEQIPIKYIDDESQYKALVTHIFTLKKANPEADTTAKEAEIDQLVYQLYGLTAEEIKIVEESVG